MRLDTNTFVKVMKTIIEFQIRSFHPSDAHVCWSLRTEAYSPEIFILLAESNPFFVVESHNKIIDFIGSKLLGYFEENHKKSKN